MNMRESSTRYQAANRPSRWHGHHTLPCYTDQMRIGIISDTHGSIPSAVYKAFSNVDRIIHAGDIGGQHVLDDLETIAPVTAVVGNCDYAEDYYKIEQAALVTLCEKRLFVTHSPHEMKKAPCGKGAFPAGTPLPHIGIHGHTHIPRNEYAGAVLMLCPGSPSRPRGGSKPSVMLLELEPGKQPCATVCSLF